MCRSACCSDNGEDAKPSEAFREMDEWDPDADLDSLFQSYQDDSACN